MEIDSFTTIERLVEIFRKNCLVQDETYISGNTARRNKIFFVNVHIVKNLAERVGDARRALLPLLKDENPHVRLQAAKFAYPVSPSVCRACIEAIAAAKLPDQSLEAGMTLRRLSQHPHCLDGPPPHYDEQGAPV